MKQHGQSYNVKLNVMLVLIKTRNNEEATHICIHLGTSFKEASIWPITTKGTFLPSF
jgi:hypothetical protein